MPVFPSVEWLEALKDRVNADESFRRLGTVDTTMGVKVGDRVYQVTFEAFECANVRETSAADLREVVFWLELPYEGWKDMLENIRRNGEADLQHTLNTIDLETPDGFARSYDGYRRDAFYRFNQSLQDFFNASAKVETTFAPQAEVVRA